MSHLLLVEDDDRVGASLARILALEGYRVSRCASLAEARREDLDRIDGVLLDIGLPDGSGMELLEDWKRGRPSLPVVVLTGSPTIESAIEGLRAGVFDYLTKPVSREKLSHVLSRALETERLRREVATLRETISRDGGVTGLVGNSRGMDELRNRIKVIAPAPTTILLEGETGTGKEVVARALHTLSGRTGRFVPVNCAALPGALLEGELFGHRKGAFTGAVADREGLAAEAAGGTLFLDEIAELGPELQGKLLRLIQNQEYRMLGDNRSRTFSGRIVAASHKDLRLEVAEGRFREDLYWRLAVVVVCLPPLRERLEDLEELTLHFIARHSARLGKRISGLERDALDALRGHGWPGNIRELENLIERSILLGKSERIEREDLVFGVPLKPPVEAAAAGDDLDEVSREARSAKLRELIEKHDGNVAAAARALGRNRTSFYALLKRHGISPPRKG